MIKDDFTFLIRHQDSFLEIFFSLFKLIEPEVTKTSHVIELIDLRNLIIVVRFRDGFIEHVQSFLDLWSNDRLVEKVFAFCHVEFDLFEFVLTFFF